MPGVLVVEGPAYRADVPSAAKRLTDTAAGSCLAAAGTAANSDLAIERFCECFRREDAICAFPLVVVVDRSEFATETFDNFLWTTFTRSNPAADIYGIEPFCSQKHWGCHGSVVIDARGKPHHAPPVVEDAAVTRRVDELAARGGPLHGVI